jgi:hypothetical protein
MTVPSGSRIRKPMLHKSAWIRICASSGVSAIGQAWTVPCGGPDVNVATCLATKHAVRDMHMDDWHRVTHRYLSLVSCALKRVAAL